MFRKLVKHEFIATRRLVPFIWLTTAVLAVINLIAGQVDISWLAGASMVFLIILAVGQVLITYVIIVTRYYKSLYSDEGYLTHTLPVKAGSLLGSKVLTSFVWLILSYLVAGAVFLIIALYIARQQDITLLQIYRDIRSTIGFEDGHTVLAGGLLIGFIAYTLLLQMAQLFFAISFGSQARFHHLGIAGPIVFYLILNFIVEMLTLTAMVFVPLGIELRMDPSGLPAAAPRLVGHGMFELIKNNQNNYVIIGLGGIIFTVIAMAALYWGSYRLIKNRTSLR